MVSKFLSEEEYKALGKMVAEKGFPLFHLIAFKIDEGGKAEFRMLSGLDTEYDIFTLKEIVEILLEKLTKWCANMAEPTRYPTADRDEVGEPKGSC